MKTIIILLIISLFSSFSLASIELVDSVESIGTIETAKTEPLSFSFILTSETATNITVTPCFGTFDVYVSLNNIVIDKTKSIYYGAWDSTVRALGTNLKSLPTGTIIYISVVPLEDYTINGKSVAASFSVLISTNEEQLVNPYLPIPAREGEVDLKLTNGGKSGTISFFKTGNSSDSYAIYTFFGTRPAGTWAFSACGVKFYATENKDQRIEDNGNNEASTTFTGLNPREPTGLTVIVTRKTKNFSNAYNYAVFNSPNSSSSLKSTILNLIPAFFICTFISFLLF